MPRHRCQGADSAVALVNGYPGDIVSFRFRLAPCCVSFSVSVSLRVVSPSLSPSRSVLCLLLCIRLALCWARVWLSLIIIRYVSLSRNKKWGEQRSVTERVTTDDGNEEVRRRE